MTLVRLPQVLLLCASFSIAPVAACQVAIKSADSQTRVVQVPGNLHLRDVVPMSPTKVGEPRFSLLKFLGDLGVQLDPTSEAIWLPDSNVAVLTMSVESLQKAESCLSPACFNLQCIQVTISIWEYETDQSALGEPPSSLKALKEVAGNSLRLAHSQVILSRSGHRTIAVSRGTVAKEAERKKAVAADSHDETRARPSLGGDIGSSIELEPVIGPDGTSFDTRLEFEFRIASTVSGTNIDLSGATNVPIVEGHDVVVHAGLLHTPDVAPAKGKQRHCAFVIGGRILKHGDAQSATLKEQFNQQIKAKKKEIIERAREGLNSQTRKHP